ncbi:hypothetical protein M9H77_34167 [Catharanthus roseus]|uniref:Uncharacterized protein n=1 Tax=Catharanthus roseus TaxID=4058 RepID=A0ACB9ZMJ5_CATRO|nr:hypothetical protein M9H77_34167 [Catharanthus roseus]
MVEDPRSKCLHYLRKSHGLPCACELVPRCQYLIPIQLVDVYIFWRKLEIGADIPDVHERDMNSEMRDLISMLEEISTGPISKVWEVRRLIKGVICLVLLEDPCPLLTNPLETAVMKGRRKTDYTKRDKSHWEYVSIAHRKIGKSSGSRFGSGSISGSRFGPSPRGRSMLPHSSRGRGRGQRVIELIRKTNWVEGSAPIDYWLDTPDNRYIIANTFNLYVVLIARFGSTIVLPLYSNMDCTTIILFIRFIAKQEHFIYELCGIAGTLVQDSVSKCECASSHSASTKVFLTTYILLFGGLRAS